MSEPVGSVCGLWRFPVKSMQGEQPASVEVTAAGIVGDRAYALVDVRTGKVLSGKTPHRGTLVLGCRAAFVEPPRADQALPPVRITLPDGTSVTSDDPAADATLSRLLGHEVSLRPAAPDDYTIDMHRIGLEGADPEQQPESVAEQKLGAALFAQIGRPSPVPPGALVDCFPVSVVTTSTLTRLASLRPESRFDVRRFRMNVVLDTPAAGFVENHWVDHVLQIGDHVHLAVAAPDARCVMTTLAQGDLPRDTEVLRAIATYNRIPMAGSLAPCVGVYAVVASAGTLRVGDPAVIG